MDLSDFDAIRVVPKPVALKIVNLSERSWDRLNARGETPPKTQLSEHRIGYRVADLKAWLDARRVQS